MSREDSHFRLRIPEGLKAQVAKAAAENNRSMTAEIITRLEATFAPPPFSSPLAGFNLSPSEPPQSVQMVVDALAEMEKRIKALEAQRPLKARP